MCTGTCVNALYYVFMYDYSYICVCECTYIYPFKLSCGVQALMSCMISCSHLTRACVYVCLHLCIHIHADICMYLASLTHKNHTHTHTHTQKETHTQTQTQTQNIECERAKCMLKICTYTHISLLTLLATSKPLFMEPCTEYLRKSACHSSRSVSVERNNFVSWNRTMCMYVCVCVCGNMWVRVCLRVYAFM